MCLNISKDRTAYKDLYQDLMLKLCQDENILAKAEKNYLKWHIVVTARNLWIDRCRKQQLTTKLFVSYALEPIQVAEDNEIESKQLAEVQYQQIDDKYTSLTETEQKLFLAYIEAGSLEKLSKLINIPKTTLDYHINNIKQKLK